MEVHDTEVVLAREDGEEDGLSRFRVHVMLARQLAELHPNKETIFII